MFTIKVKRATCAWSDCAPPLIVEAHLIEVISTACAPNSIILCLLSVRRKTVQVSEFALAILVNKVARVVCALVNEQRILSRFH